MVAGESVFMEMMHQQLQCLIYGACEEQSNKSVRTSPGSHELWKDADKTQRRCRKCQMCLPKASWERANDMLKGDMMIFGCSGVASRFCSSCTPSF